MTGSRRDPLREAVEYLNEHGWPSRDRAEPYLTGFAERLAAARPAAVAFARTDAELAHVLAFRSVRAVYDLGRAAATAELAALADAGARLEAESHRAETWKRRAADLETELAIARAGTGRP